MLINQPFVHNERTTIMSIRQDFDTTLIQRKYKVRSKIALSALRRLIATEDRCIELVRLFLTKSYLSPNQLAKELLAQKLPGSTLESMACFLAGYCSAESFDSRFDVALFGEHSTFTEAKYETAVASFHALFALMRDKHLTKLPNRAVKPKRAAKKGRKPSQPTPKKTRRQAR